MTASLVKELLCDERSTTLRRSDRAVLVFLAKIAGPDGRPQWPIRTKTLAARIDYGQEAVRKSLRRLSGRDPSFPHQVIACESGTGHLSSRFTVALSWDQAPPAFLPREEEAKSARPVAPSLDEEPPEEETAPPPPEEDEPESVETAARKARVPSDVDAAAAIAGAGAGAGFPRQAAPDGDVVQLRPTPSTTWCAAARKAGRAHEGRRCCGLSVRQIKERDEEARKAAARKLERERFEAEFGTAAAARKVPSEDAIEKNSEYAAARAAAKARKEAS